MSSFRVAVSGFFAVACVLGGLVVLALAWRGRSGDHLLTVALLAVGLTLVLGGLAAGRETLRGSREDRRLRAPFVPVGPDGVVAGDARVRALAERLRTTLGAGHVLLTSADGVRVADAHPGPSGVRRGLTLLLDGDRATRVDGVWRTDDAGRWHSIRQGGRSLRVHAWATVGATGVVASGVTTEGAPRGLDAIRAALTAEGLRQRMDALSVGALVMALLTPAVAVVFGVVWLVAKAVGYV